MKTSVAVLLGATLLLPAIADGAVATGPLRVSPENPRYFTDGSGKVIYLTGSHNWFNLQDAGEVGGPVTHTLDYAAYLDLLRTNGHNFTRLWSYEGWEADATPAFYQPLPFRRTGPGKALDGGLKFDLSRFEPEYFQRLRGRVIAARDQGIYVSVMLFNGWSIQKNMEIPGPDTPSTG